MTVVMVGIDIAVLLMYPCATGISLNALQARKNLTSGVVTLVHCIICEFYFDHVRVAIYDDMRIYSDTVQSTVADKEAFFATMSHEVRNPLQSLLGSVELLQQTPQNHRELVTIIKNCCDVVLNLVSNILDMSKIDAQKLELLKVPSHMTECISKVIRLSAGRTKAKGLKLKYVETNALPPCLLFDPQRLGQIVLNLVSNAIKFTHRGKIVVAASWLPLPVALDPRKEEETAAEIVRQELKNSSWKTIMDPLQEVEDRDSELQKRLKVTFINCCSPSRILEVRS